MSSISMASSSKIPYGEYIRLLAREHRGLANLSDILNVEKPSSEAFVTTIDYPRARQDGTVAPSIASCTEHDALTMLPPECHGRIILVENINAALIESLGSGLDIDPFFFASHTEASPKGPINRLYAASRERLPSQLIGKDSLHLSNKRVLDLGVIYAFENEQHRRHFITTTNLPRTVHLLPYSPGKRQLAVMSGYCSMTLKRRGDSWICLILFDPVVETVQPKSQQGVSTGILVPCRELQRTFTLNELPAYSSFDRYEYQRNSGRNSFRDRIIRSFRKSPPGFDPVSPTILSIAYYPIRLVAAELVAHTKLMFLYLGQYDFSEPSTEAHIEVNERNIYALSQWRTRSCITLSRLKYLAEFITHWSSKQPGEEAFAMLLRDINDLSLQTKDLADATEHVMRVVMTMIQLLDARRAILEAVNVKRVTYIALVFVPLSWVATIFSMGDEYLPGGSRFWIYFATALPLLALVSILSMFPHERLPLKRFLQRELPNAPGNLR